MSNCEQTQTRFWVEWKRDGDTWVAAFCSEAAAINAVDRNNNCEDWDGDSPIRGVYLGEW